MFQWNNSKDQISFDIWTWNFSKKKSEYPKFGIGAEVCHSFYFCDHEQFEKVVKRQVVSLKANSIFSSLFCFSFTMWLEKTKRFVKILKVQTSFHLTFQVVSKTFEKCSPTLQVLCVISPKQVFSFFFVCQTCYKNDLWWVQ